MRRYPCADLAVQLFEREKGPQVTAVDGENVLPGLNRLPMLVLPLEHLGLACEQRSSLRRAVRGLELAREVRQQARPNPIHGANARPRGPRRAMARIG